MAYSAPPAFRLRRLAPPPGTPAALAARSGRRYHPNIGPMRRQIVADTRAGRQALPFWYYRRPFLRRERGIASGFQFRPAGQNVSPLSRLCPAQNGAGQGFKAYCLASVAAIAPLRNGGGFNCLICAAPRAWDNGTIKIPLVATHLLSRQAVRQSRRAVSSGTSGQAGAGQLSASRLHGLFSESGSRGKVLCPVPSQYPVP